MIEDGWVVVSGGAAGADTYAHQIALDHKGKTIVVVGSGQTTVQDCNTLNGTYVNGKRIFEETPLKAGDEISIGKVIRFAVEGTSLGLVRLAA